MSIMLKATRRAKSINGYIHVQNLGLHKEVALMPGRPWNSQRREAANITPLRIF
jgi:hypothetical protein